MRGNEIAFHTPAARVVVAEIELRRLMPAPGGFLVPARGHLEILTQAEATGVEPGEAVHRIDVTGLGGSQPFTVGGGVVAAIIGLQTVAEIGKRRAAATYRGDEGCGQGETPQN